MWLYLADIEFRNDISGWNISETVNKKFKTKIPLKNNNLSGDIFFIFFLSWLNSFTVKDFRATKKIFIIKIELLFTIGIKNAPIIINKDS